MYILSSYRTKSEFLIFFSNVSFTQAIPWVSWERKRPPNTGKLKDSLNRDTKVICKIATDEERETEKLMGNDFCFGYHEKLPRHTHMCLVL